MSYFFFIPQSPEEGADTELHVALSPDIGKKKCGYYDNCELKEPHSDAFSTKLRLKLWIRSCNELNIPLDWIGNC